MPLRVNRGLHRVRWVRNREKNTPILIYFKRVVVVCPLSGISYNTDIEMTNVKCQKVKMQAEIYIQQYSVSDFKNVAHD